MLDAVGKHFRKNAASALPLLLVACGLAAASLWSDMLGHSSALQASADAVAPYANARTFYLTGLLAGAIGIIVFSWPTKARHRSLSVAAHLGTGVLLSLATLCYGAASKLNLVPVGLMVVVCLLVSGAGFAWFSIHLLAQLARQRQQRLILASIAAGLLLKTAFAPLVHGVFASESQFVTALLLPLVVSVAAIALQCAASGSTVPELSSLPKASTTDSRILVILLLATALLRAIIRMISTMGFWGSGPTSNSLLQVFDIALVTLLLVVAVWVTLLKQRDQTLSLRFLPAYLIILAGFFFLDPQIIDIVGINTWLAYVINIFFELFTHLFFWYLIVCGMRALALHPYKVGGLTVFAYALVSAVSTLLFSQADATYRLSAVILLYVIIIIIMSIFKLTNKEKTSAAEATATPAATPAAGHATPTSDHLIALAQENGLSPRETEVFMLLARGRSRSFIQQELVLADGTVKTHISRIYQKLGVSGRQELISLVLGT